MRDVGATVGTESQAPSNDAAQRAAPIPKPASEEAMAACASTVPDSHDQAVASSIGACAPIAKRGGEVDVGSDVHGLDIEQQERLETVEKSDIQGSTQASTIASTQASTQESIDDSDTADADDVDDSVDDSTVDDIE